MAGVFRRAVIAGGAQRECPRPRNHQRDAAGICPGGGVDFIYVSSEPSAPVAEAIAVQHDSPIRSVAQLRGKRVVLKKGSNVYYILVRARCSGLG